MQMSTNAETSDIYTEYYFQAVENIDIGIKTILDAVNNVKFNEENLNKLKKPIIQEIRNRMDNKFYHLNKMVMNDVFGESGTAVALLHKYGLDAEGIYNKIKAFV